jgi:hypothetical protein
MAFELSPDKNTTVMLSNAAWVFITQQIRKLPYGEILDANQQDLLVSLTQQIIESNGSKEPSGELL